MSLISDLDPQNNTSKDEIATLAMCIASWPVPSMVFKTVLDLNVFDIIHAAGPAAQLSAVDIAAQLPANNPNAADVLDRLLRLLASFGILTFSTRDGVDGRVERLYGLTPVTKFLLRNGEEGSFASVADLTYDKIAINTWEYLKDAILEGGIAFNRAYGQGLFDYLATDSRFHHTFFNAANHSSTIVDKEFLDNYKGFEGISSLVDVGGATGLTLRIIIEKYPNIRGICFDLPHVIKDAPADSGIEYIGGDMFVSVPRADAILIKRTFYLGSDEQCVKLLRNCYNALPKEGKVIICEFVAPELPENNPTSHLALITDAIMLTFQKGKIRSLHEHEALGKRVGFHSFKVVCYACGNCVMEHHKIQ